MSTATDIFSSTVQKTHEWLLDLMAELVIEDEHKALRALKAGLHALRDRITVDEVLQLGAQLPALLRGYYFEGWKLGGKNLKERHLKEFLKHVEDEISPDPDLDPEEVARAVFKVLSNRVTRGEIKDIVNILPKEVREIWP